MKFKEYEMPDGRKAVFEYDENGVGKITLECIDMLMGLINDRKTENCSEKPNNCETCKHNKLEWNYAEIVYPTDEYIMVAHEKAIHLVRKDSNVRVIIDRRPQPDCPWK